MINLRIALDEGGNIDQDGHCYYARIPGVYEAWVCYNEEKAFDLLEKGYEYPHQTNHGDSRIEAVAKAFLSIYCLRSLEHGIRRDNADGFVETFNSETKKWESTGLTHKEWTDQFNKKYGTNIQYIISI